MTRAGDPRGRRIRHLARVGDAVPASKRTAAAAEQMRTLARQAQVPILFGSDQFERGRPARSRSIYNSAFLVRADGTTGGVYRKMHLVPFGEYVPLKRLLFFAAPLVEAVVRFLGRRGRGAAAGRRPPDQHRDLLRSRLSRSGAAVRRRRQRDC